VIFTKTQPLLRRMEELIMNSIKWILSAGVLIFGIALYTPSFAEGSMETHKEEIELTRASIKLQKKQIIAKNMKLTSFEKDKFWKVYRAYQDKMDSVSKKRVKVITDYADTLKTGSLTDEKAMEMLNEYLSYERMRLITKQSFVDKFKKFLPSRKVARFFQIENKLEAIINFELARQIPLFQ
jgi:hypothetical protein